MKRQILEFFRRGLMACGFGPIILALVYLVLQQQNILNTLTVNEVSLGIISLFLLAFIAGGMNFIYQIERLPLMVAIFIHGFVLYVSYLITYLLNNWLRLNLTSILVFSGIFVVGYLAIWAVIYVIIKRKTKRLNEILQQKQQNLEEK